MRPRPWPRPDHGGVRSPIGRAWETTLAMFKPATTTTASETVAAATPSLGGGGQKGHIMLRFPARLGFLALAVVLLAGLSRTGTSTAAAQAPPLPPLPAGPPIPMQ